MHQRISSIALLLFLAVTATASVAFASTGTIVSPHQYAWDDNAGYVNWLATGGNVIVSDTALAGYIWSAGFGWINLSPTNGGVTDNNGTLSGYAWGANTGWIDFTGVTIDSSGVFHGHTVAQSTFGTMTFDCTYCDVVTSWRATGTTQSSTTPTNGMPAQSGPLSYGYQATSTVPTSHPATAYPTPSPVPPSLRPTSPPPRIQPTTKPVKISAHVVQQAAAVAAAVPPSATPAVTRAPVPAIRPTVTPAPAPPAPSCSLFTCWLQGLFQFFHSII